MTMVRKVQWHFTNFVPKLLAAFQNGHCQNRKAEASISYLVFSRVIDRLHSGTNLQQTALKISVIWMFKSYWGLDTGIYVGIFFLTGYFYFYQNYSLASFQSELWDVLF